MGVIENNCDDILDAANNILPATDLYETLDSTLFDS